jgi:ribosomal protein S28E/S33
MNFLRVIQKQRSAVRAVEPPLELSDILRLF